jgi:hypothetical protein
MGIKTLTLYLLIGLTLPTIKGSEVETALQADSSACTRFNHFVEKRNKTWREILEQKLHAYTERHTLLTKRIKLIDHNKSLLLTHLEHAQNPKEGYDILLEEILALRDPYETPRQMMSMRSSIFLASLLQVASLDNLRAELKQKKQSSLNARIDKINRLVLQSDDLRETNIHFLDRLKTVFDKNVELLSHYQDQENLSKWSLDLPLATEETDNEATLPVFADVASNHETFIEIIRAEDFKFIRTILELNTARRSALMALYEEAKSHKKTPWLDEMMAELEKDIASTNEYIEKDGEKLKATGAQN